MLGLMVLLAQFLSKGSKYAHRTETISGVQREATKLTRALSLDLSRSTVDRFQWGAGSMIFLSSRSVDSNAPAVEFDPVTGGVMWREWAAYYLDQSAHVVRRFQQALAPPTSDPIAPDSLWQLADLPDLPQDQGRVVARNIEDFSPTGKATSQSIEIKVVAKDVLKVGNVSNAEKNVQVEISTIIRLGSVKKP